MKRTASKFLYLTTGLVLAFGVEGSFAHHSGSKYDFEKTITVEGTVKEFQWTNPHVILWVNVDREENEQPELWAFQTTSPGNLTRGGWTHRSLTADDRVRVKAYPLRDGGRGGGISEVTILATGEVLRYIPLSRARESASDQE